MQVRSPRSVRGDRLGAGRQREPDELRVVVALDQAHLLLGPERGDEHVEDTELHVGLGSVDDPAQVRAADARAPRQLRHREARTVPELPDPRDDMSHGVAVGSVHPCPGRLEQVQVEAECRVRVRQREEIKDVPDIMTGASRDVFLRQLLRPDPPLQLLQPPTRAHLITVECAVVMCKRLGEAGVHEHC